MKAQSPGLVWRFCLLFTVPVLSAVVMAQVLNGSAEIAINAMRGFIGDEFTVLCSSMPVRPGTRLSIRWSTLEGSNPPVSVGECHSVRAGFREWSAVRALISLSLIPTV